MGGIEGQLVSALSILVLAWYFLGQQAMRRRGLSLLQRVQGEVAILGHEPQLRWLGSSAFQVSLQRPVQPFRALAVTVVLEPREIIFLWLVNRFRRRRDLLVVRGDLTARPRIPLELFREEGRSGAEAKAMAQEARWPIAPFDQSGLRLATPSPRGVEWLHACLGLMHDHGQALVRLSIRETSPHFLVNYTLQPQSEDNVGQIFRCLVEVARASVPSSV